MRKMVLKNETKAN
jgi:hypothetical protein